MAGLCAGRLGCAPLDVDAEERRIAKASPARLQLETAATWVSRAAAFARLAAREKRAGRASHAARAAAQRDDALHEALEHAALADPSGKAVARVRAAFRAAVGRSATRRR